MLAHYAAEAIMRPVEESIKQDWWTHCARTLTHFAGRVGFGGRSYAFEIDSGFIGRDVFGGDGSDG
jgi:hypothetical protein